MSNEENNITSLVKKRTEFPFYITPNNVMDKDVGFNIYQKMVYIYLIRCTNNGSTAFPSYATISRTCCMSSRQAIRTIKELEKLGFLTKETRKSDNNNLSNIYVVDKLDIWE